MARGELGRDELELIEAINDKGVTLTPCGNIVLISLMQCVRVHMFNHGMDLTPRYALEIADEFMTEWVRQRLAENPNWLKEVEKQKHEPTQVLFHETTNDIDITKL